MKLLIAFLVIAVLALAGLFGLSSVSQSYASARQAQAAIEASRTAQMAVAGNLVVIVALALLVVLLGGVIVVLLLRARPSSSTPQAAGQKRWASGPNAMWAQEPTGALPDPQTLLLSMMAYQMMQQQRQAQPPQPMQVPALSEPEEDWSSAWQDILS